ncbi:MAG: DoxX family protein [Algoriphagus sp.]|uniref:DoxX family protein n=1 Tax=Algoriphagus sp. TaxID=1872435 RepID=UPI002631B4BC|nr:DoxX family protein [Algoriphagus sp.]MDG1278669.1 DoxX family protein [Algoriphagus sp.]
MSFAKSLDRLHAQARQNKWLWYFAIFIRIILAYGFIFPGMIKILSERFTSLPNYHPMGAYLEALHHTGYYYTFIGIAQVLAGILLLIPRTALMGALLYLPIILNITILSLAVRFEGSLITSPLMTLAVLYLLGWYYHRWKYILPFNSNSSDLQVPTFKELSNKFPFRFFLGAFLVVVIIVSSLIFGFKIMPRNSLKDCMSQCEDNVDPAACQAFCEGIHLKEKRLDESLDAYHKAVWKNKE